MRGIAALANPLHICFISQEYPPETGWGDIGSYTQDIARELVAEGHRVTVIARSAGQKRVQDDAGVSVHRIAPVMKWDRWPVLWRLNCVWPAFSWAAVLRLRAIQQQSKIDLIEAGECRAEGFFLCREQNGPPLVVRLHAPLVLMDEFNSVKPDGRKRLIYWLERRAILGAHAITAPTRAVVDTICTKLRLPQLNPWIIPDAVDLATFHPGEEGAESEEILFVGRLELRKGVLDLADAVPQVLQRHPKATFRFVGCEALESGAGSMQSQILSRIPPSARTSLRFERADRSQLASRYRRATVCVVPSKWENSPYVLLEAMACGTPVVATKVGGIPELLEDGVSGLLVPPEDPQALAEAICELLEDPACRARMGAAGRWRAEQSFGTSRIVPRLLDVYRRVLDAA